MSIIKAETNDINVMTILMVEDNPSQALRFKLTLEKNGCQVHWASSGEDGLKAAEDGDFDLITLDVELPGINGFEVCRRLKANPDLAHIPVIMMTTRDRAEDALMGLGEGAIDYIPKDPFAEAVLIATLQQMDLK